MSRYQDLGSLNDINDRRHRCQFCLLVSETFSDPESSDLQVYNENKILCRLNWEVDGREAATGSGGRRKGRTRRIHLSWYHNEELVKDSYLVFMAPERYVRPNSDAPAVWGDENLFLGRNISEKEDKGVLIRSWLRLCQRYHERLCGDGVERYRKDDFQRMVSQSFFGIIDVLRMRLTSLPHDAPYVALSYVWGNGNPYKTTIKNVMLHRSEGGLGECFEQLPRVIRDAITLVRRLGLRYIWIDSLCIVQDSPHSWRLNARVMDLIYGNAILTICGADGDDSNAGLKAMLDLY